MTRGLKPLFSLFVGALFSFLITHCGAAGLSKKTDRTPYDPEKELENENGNAEPHKFFFVNPGSSNERSDQNFLVKISSNISKPEVVWSLYYTKQKNDYQNGKLIASGLKYDLSEYWWDTTAVANGSYYLFAIVSMGGENFVTCSSGTVFVSHPEPGNNPPNLKLKGFSEPITLIAGASVDIEYEAADPDVGDIGKLKFTLELSSDSGQTWNVIGSNIAQQIYGWLIPSDQAEDVRYRLRVTANDGRGGIAVATGETDFGNASKMITYTNAIANILASCAGEFCHTNGAQGGFNINSYKTNVFEKRKEFLTAISRDANDPRLMPVTGPLPKEQIRQVQLWIWDGARE